MKHTIKPYYNRVRERNDFIDFFNREEFATNLTQLFDSTEDSLTLTINANWGEGKTTFIKLWEDKLQKNERFIPIYYDAFENDFASDAFMSIAVTIQEAVREYYERHGLKFNRQQIVERYKEVALDLGIELAKMGANTLITSISHGTVDSTGFIKKIFGVAKKIDKRENKALVDEKYDAFLNRKETIQEYQNVLSSLLQTGGKEDTRKIIFFVDELDRCRPDFAIQVIEKIKHLFEVENVNFVLSINKDQLAQIVRNAYGLENDSDALMYLQKFVHVETSLPTLKDLRTQEPESIKRFIQYLINEYEIENFDFDGYYKLINTTIGQWSYTPRSMERTMTLYTISLGSCSQRKQRKLFRHIMLLSLLKIHAPNSYNKFKNSGTLRTTSHNQRNWNTISSGLITYLQKGNYIPKNGVEEVSSNTVKIKDIQEAGKIVDMYDFPEIPKGISDEGIGKDDVNVISDK